jgi:hypothetical protein
MLGLVKNHIVASLIGRSLFAFRHLVLGTAVEISGLLSCFQLSVNMSQALSSHWAILSQPCWRCTVQYKRSDRGDMYTTVSGNQLTKSRSLPTFFARRDDLFQMLLYDFIMFKPFHAKMISAAKNKAGHSGHLFSKLMVDPGQQHQ